MLLEWLVRKSWAWLPLQGINKPPHPTLSTLSHIFCSIVVARLCLHCCTEVLSRVCFTQNFDLLTFSPPDGMARNFLHFTFGYARAPFHRVSVPFIPNSLFSCWEQNHLERGGIEPRSPCSSSEATALASCYSSQMKLSQMIFYFWKTKNLLSASQSSSEKGFRNGLI